MDRPGQWNWEKSDWPTFQYRSGILASLEAEFLHKSGLFLGALRHFSNQDQQFLTIELLCDEAIHTSEIEGELLDRASVQSSMRRVFGLETDHRRVTPAENGISEMMRDLYTRFAEPLTHNHLHGWHRLLMQGRRDLRDAGRYRTGSLPMRVISGPDYDPKIHFEAPPSNRVPAEMDRFISWYTRTAPGGSDPLPMLTRAGIAHLYFVCIHPFEDGNGRIARAIVEKTISEGLGTASLVALSHTINRARRKYYEMLEASNKANEITAWLEYFARTLLDAQERAQVLVEFTLAKTRYFDAFRDRFNPRQARAIARMLREGPDGFQGGLSAENYLSITKTSRATATRDLRELVAMGALRRTGELKGTRYWLPLSGLPTV